MLPKVMRGVLNFTDAANAWSIKHFIIKKTGIALSPQNNFFKLLSYIDNNLITDFVSNLLSKFVTILKTKSKV